jgi:NADPH-dependent 2,4-dienoyl-CoA reductase/sulfur reductase-like enzyme
MPSARGSVPAVAAVVAAAIAIGTVAARQAGYSGIPGWTIVRCRDGHLFTTIWIPGASLKSLRLGLFRFQYCPAGKHWTSVRPVRDAELTEDDRIIAGQHRDIPIP